MSDSSYELSTHWGQLLVQNLIVILRRQLGEVHMERMQGLWVVGGNLRQRKSQASSVFCLMPVYSLSSLAPLPEGRELTACEWAQCHPTRWEWEQAARGTCKCLAVFVKQTIPSWGALKQLSILILQTLVTGDVQSLIRFWEELPFKLFFF